MPRTDTATHEPLQIEQSATFRRLLNSLRRSIGQSRTTGKPADTHLFEDLGRYLMVNEGRHLHRQVPNLFSGVDTPGGRRRLGSEAVRDMMTHIGARVAHDALHETENGYTGSAVVEQLQTYFRRESFPTDRDRLTAQLIAKKAMDDSMFAFSTHAFGPDATRDAGLRPSRLEAVYAAPPVMAAGGIGI